MKFYAIIGALYTTVVWLSGYLAGQASAKPRRDSRGKFVGKKKLSVRTAPADDSLGAGGQPPLPNQQ